MLARDSTSGCYSDTSKSQGSLGAWGSFDAHRLLALCRQRFLDMRLIVQDHESVGLVTTKLSDEDASDRTRVLVRGSPNFRRSHLLNSSMSGKPWPLKSNTKSAILNEITRWVESGSDS